jgi:hypothetical protein
MTDPKLLIANLDVPEWDSSDAAETVPEMTTPKTIPQMQLLILRHTLDCHIVLLIQAMEPGRLWNTGSVEAFVTLMAKATFSLHVTGILNVSLIVLNATSCCPVFQIYRCF